MSQFVSEFLEESKRLNIEFNPIDVFLWKIAGAETCDELASVRREIAEAKLDDVTESRLNLVCTLASNAMIYKSLSEVKR